MWKLSFKIFFWLFYIYKGFSKCIQILKLYSSREKWTMTFLKTVLLEFNRLIPAIFLLAETPLLIWCKASLLHFLNILIVFKSYTWDGFWLRNKKKPQRDRSGGKEDASLAQSCVLPKCIKIADQKYKEISLICLDCNLDIITLLYKLLNCIHTFI